MKNTRPIISILNILSFICTPATLVLAVLWYLRPDGNYEPITVALGSLSIIFFSTSQLLQKKVESTEIKKQKISELSTDEILDFVKDSNPDNWDVHFSEDIEIAVYKNDPALRIEFKHTNESVHNFDFRERWANKFPDPNATSYYYYLYYGSTRLKEFILVSVDGGRARLPLPKSAIDFSVEPIRYKIALIFDRFDTCNAYMERAGLYLANQK
jgi:hypothetical protein